jgi:hypothetical protein
LGDLNLKLTNDGAQPVNYLVEEVIRHPQYKPPAKYNDIALLKLDHPVELNEFIRPACLHTTDTFPINKTVATGWGRIDYGKRTQNKIVYQLECGHLEHQIGCDDNIKMDLMKFGCGHGK